MSTKYNAQSTTRLVADDVALTDHAILRYNQRTPHDCDIDPRVAYQRGENIEHPSVAKGPNEDEPPRRVRVYKHDQDWGVAFLIDEADQPTTIADRSPYVVVTVVDFDGFDHGPARAYLHSHGPHGGVIADE